MATLATTLRSPAPTRPLAQSVTIYLKEAKYEFLKNLRLPIYSISTVGFPVMFYILFGLLLGRQSGGPIQVASYAIAAYGTFGVMGTSLFGTAAGLASDRGLGWLQVKRASPMPPFAYFMGKVIMSMIFSLTVVLLLLLLGTTLGGVHLAPATAVKLVAILVAGSLPFCAMGLAIGYFVGPTSAPAVINLVYLPMSFLSGLWIPFMFLPKVLKQIAHFLPPYHLSQLALRLVNAGSGEPDWLHWEILIGFTLLCLGVAYYGFRRDEGKMYG